MLSQDSTPVDAINGVNSIAIQFHLMTIRIYGLLRSRLNGDGLLLETIIAVGRLKLASLDFKLNTHVTVLE